MAERSRNVLVDDLVFAEGPRWHEGRLWFSDIRDQKICAVDPAGKLEVIAELDFEPSGLGWLPDGRLLVVSMLDHKLLRLEAGGPVEVADLSAYCGGHLNDMVVDARGRAFIGNIGFDISVEPLEPRPTNIVSVDPDGSARVAAPGVMSPNGMVITPDSSTLIVAESAAMRLAAFAIRDDGTLGELRVFADLPGGATADGICLDAEGAVWVASPTTSEFLRVRDGGEVAERIEVGDRIAIACMLGGPDRKTLYALTAGTMKLHEARAERSARIEAIGVDVGGVGWP